MAIVNEEEDCETCRTTKRLTTLFVGLSALYNLLGSSGSSISSSSVSTTPGTFGALTGPGSISCTQVNGVVSHSLLLTGFVQQSIEPDIFSYLALHTLSKLYTKRLQFLKTPFMAFQSKC